MAKAGTKKTKKEAKKTKKEAKKINSMKTILEAMGAEPTDEAIKGLEEADPEEIVKNLRTLGVLEKPGVLAALSGWHDVKHLLAKGAGNKIEGAGSLGAKGAVIVYGGVKLYEYLTRA